ncbi:sigma-70 family RNA polymerase sigma factor, partial [Thalassiella azotivora]
MTASTSATQPDGARDGYDGLAIVTDLAAAPEAPSDAELLAAARTGDAEAYGELFRRHSPAARALARQLTKHPSDADDLVSEAFTKVLNALRNGNGPTSALRPYLLTAVRRVHVDRAVAGQRVKPVEDMTDYDPGEPFVDPAVAGLERTLVAKAYSQLPERWQAVLWHTEVEGMHPRDLAPLLGMSANAVSALAMRARSGLRDAYLAAHVPAAQRRDCEATMPRLAAYVRGSTSVRETSAVEAHLDACEDCRAVAADLKDVGVGMRAIVAPIVLGGAVTAYLVELGATGAAAATAGSAVGAGSSGAGSSGAGSSGAGASGTGATGTGASSAGATTGASTTGASTVGASGTAVTSGAAASTGAASAGALGAG